jgi:hypothetical protein
LAKVLRTEMQQLRPSFFIVGAPKAGTTALYDYLVNHPQVCMSTDKEPNYFSEKEIREQGLYYRKANPQTEEEYLSLFKADKQHLIAGEGSVSYLFYPEVAQRIYNFNPNARIIISLRDPVQRAFSHYQMDYSLGLVTTSFDQIAGEGKDSESLKLFYQQYIELGFYYQQVKRYLDVFPSGQVLVLLHEDLIHHPAETLKKLSGFLGISYTDEQTGLREVNVSGAPRSGLVKRIYQNETARKFLASIINEDIRLKIKSRLFSKKNLPVLSAKTRLQLISLYRKDIQQVSTLIKRNLEHWVS